MIFYILFVSVIAVHGMIEPHHPQPYSFGYAIKDHEGSQHRQESGNGAGVVKGNYGFTDNKGIHRQVDYMADHAGFRAMVKTNEPGTAGQSPAAVHMMSSDNYGHGVAVPYESNSVHGFPTLYGHRAYDHGHYKPREGYKFITPMQENKHHMPVHMPNHHHDHHAPHHMPLHHQSQHTPMHMSSHLHNHQRPVHVPSHHDRMPVHMPLHMNEHYMPVHVPAHHHDYTLSHVPLHSHILHHSYENEHGYEPMMYSPMYMGGLAHSGLLGAGYRNHGRRNNYGANLVGGVVRGHDSRYSNL